MKSMGILSFGVLIMIVNSSQHQAAFAGACYDADHDGYYAPNSAPYCGTLLDCNDNDPNVYPGKGGCADVTLDDVIIDIQNLISNGSLTSGQGNSLITKLHNAAVKIDSHNYTAAINSLNAFINQVNAFINSGKISHDDGTALIQEAQSIIASLK